ncbi:MAG TPA: hypothetical protein VFY99_08830, partial [Solirubrobacterales bacterium]
MARFTDRCRSIRWIADSLRLPDDGRRRFAIEEIRDSLRPGGRGGGGGGGRGFPAAAAPAA